MKSLKIMALMQSARKKPCRELMTDIDLQKVSSGECCYVLDNHSWCEKIQFTQDFLLSCYIFHKPFALRLIIIIAVSHIDKSDTVPLPMYIHNRITKQLSVYWYYLYHQGANSNKLYFSLTLLNIRKTISNKWSTVFCCNRLVSI